MKSRTGIAAASFFSAGVVAGILIHMAISPGGGHRTAATGLSGTGEAGHDEDRHGERIVRVSDEELEEFGVEVATAGPGRLRLHVDLAGEVTFDPDRVAHIVPRFPGVVREVRKKIGDRVEKGEVIAVIESNESLSPYEVRSLIDGTVIELHMTRGELIENADHSVVVADLSRVWVNLSVYQKDLPHVRLGQPVTIEAGPDHPEARGVVDYVSPVVDEETRTAIARVVLPNRDGEWKPGLFVKGVLTVGEVDAEVAVPKTAIEMLGGQSVVFVRTDGGFRPRVVMVGRSNDTHVEIVGGLAPGQRYVVRNGFTLKAELEKGAFGEGHGH
jgi:cobalt-zinc-cadmium efflux system membrane fusion protein